MNFEGYLKEGRRQKNINAWIKCIFLNWMMKVSIVYIKTIFKFCLKQFISWIKIQSNHMLAILSLDLDPFLNMYIHLILKSA